jgi:branched-chain amino acid transport system ATP-binding protein
MVQVYADTGLCRSNIDRSILEIRSISKSFGNNSVIQDLCFRIAEGEIVGIFGQRCSGKSTLISLLSGEASPNSGQILFRGEDIENLPPGAHQENGIVRSSPVTSLLPELTVRDHLLLAGTAQLWPLFPRQGRVPYDEEVEHVLELTGLGRLAGKRVSTLSQAQKYFLTIAIALAGAPAVLLLDNPFLEIKAGPSDLAAVLTRIADRGTTVLFTEEWLYPAIDVCDWLAVLHRGEVVAKGFPSCLADNPSMVSAYLNN